MPYPFPLIYLDNNATTQPAPEVVDAVAQAMRTAWANPSSVHRAGQDARHAVELARASVAALLGAKPKNITFTSGGTESINTALRGILALAAPQHAARAGAEIELVRARLERHNPAGDQAARTAAHPDAPAHRVVSTEIEHAAVRDWLGRTGVAFLALDLRGIVAAESIERPIVPGVRLVTVQWANNETGAVQPVAAIAARCRQVGALFHCDATQWVGKMPVDLNSNPPPCDILTCSSHKWHGPKGVGVLWARPGVRIPPFIHGTQEQGRRGGTENTEGIIGAGVAAQLANAWLADHAARGRLGSLRDRFERRVLAENPGAVVNGPTDPALRLWNTTNIAFPRLEAEALLMAFSERGLYASAGAACSSGSLDPSPVLLAMGVPPELAHGSVRFSLSRYTTAEEIERAADIVAETVRKVRGSMTG